MTRPWMRILSLPLAAALLLVAGLVVAQGQEQGPESNQTAIRTLFEQVLRGVQTRNAERTVGFWHTDSGEFPLVQKRFAAFFPLQRYQFSNLQVTRIQGTADEMTARVIIDVVVTTGSSTGRPDRQRWIRTVTLRPQGGVWHIWREASPIEALIRRLQRVQAQDERMALLAEDPDLITPDLARELEREVMVMGLRPEQALDWYRMMEHVAREAKSVELAGAALIGRARAHETLKETSAAQDLYARAIAEFEAAGLPERVGDAEETVATSFFKRLDYANARAHLQRAVSAFERGADKGLLASALHRLGTMEYFQGEWDQALTHYRRSLETQQALLVAEGVNGSNNRRRGVAAAYQAIGMVNQERGDFEAAAEAYAESLRRFRELDEAAGVIAVTVDLARLSRRQGNPDAALRQYLESLDVASRVDSAYRDLPRIAGIMREVAELLTLERRYKGALDYYQRSLETSAQDGIKRVRAPPWQESVPFTSSRDVTTLLSGSTRRAWPFARRWATSRPLHGRC